MDRPWQKESGQVATIARATFKGFLESDLMPSGMQAPAMIWVAAFLGQTVRWGGADFVVAPDGRMMPAPEADGTPEPAEFS